MTGVVPEEPEAGADPVHARIVVVDTNMSDDGNFNAGKIAGLAARLSAQGVKLWVPQIVVWEWAAHAVDKQDEAFAALRRLERLGIPQTSAVMPKKLTRQELIDAIEDKLRATSNVEIVPALGASAIEAIKDQILLTGPGVRAGKAKTGAADSALVRDSAHHIGQHRLGDLVLLSKNVKDMRNTLKTIPNGDAVRVIANEKTLIDGLTSFHALRRQEGAEVRGIITEYFELEEKRLQDDDDGHGVPAESWVTELVTDIDTSSLPTDAYMQFDQVTNVQVHPNSHVIGISGVNIDESNAGEVRYASFDLILDTLVQIEGYTVDARDGEVVMGNDEVDTVLEVGCVAELRGTEVVAVRQVDQATAHDMGLMFSDEGDARAWLVEYVREATNTRIKDEGTIEGGLPERRTLITPTGMVVASVHFGEPHPDAVAGNGAVWSARFLVGPDEDPAAGEVECLHDASAHVSLGGGDYYDLYPPYRLSPDGGALLGLLAKVRKLVADADLVGT